MKTLILNGSPKSNGDTVALIKELCKYLEGEIKVVSAHFDNISPCVDCRYCWTHSGCAVKDGMQNIYRYLEDCDNIVIASPIWFSELSGPLLNLASRIQTYYAAYHFRREKTVIKPKRSMLMLVGGQNGTERKAVETAHTIFKLFNALPCIASVFSLDTDNVPASEDKNALYKIRETALLLSRFNDETNRF
jgi:multimeric flavodoxin WrbA